MKCNNIPDGGAISPDITCVSCNGENIVNCDACGKTGRMVIEGCPEKLITPDIWEAIMLADLWEKGIPPVAGGSLDQARVFVLAANFIFADKNRWKKELGILS